MSNTVAILSARGVFYRVPVYDDFSPAYYQIEELVAAPTQQGLDLKNTLTRQSQAQQNALGTVNGQTSLLKQVQNNLTDPDELAGNPALLERHQSNLQQLATAGVIDPATQIILANPISPQAPASADKEAFTNTRDNVLPEIISSSQAHATQLGQQLQRAKNALGQATNPPDNTLDRSQILITGVQIGKRDVISQVLCLNNAKVLYSFGQNFGDVAIRGEVLLGGVGDAQTAEQGVRTLRQWFETNRVSRSLMPVAVSVAADAFYVYLTGMVIQDIDEFHCMPFVIMGTLLDLPQQQMKNVNPAGTVTSLTESALDLPMTALEQALAKRKTLAAAPAPVTSSSANSTSASDTRILAPATALDNAFPASIALTAQQFGAGLFPATSPVFSAAMPEDPIAANLRNILSNSALVNAAPATSVPASVSTIANPNGSIFPPFTPISF